MTYLVTDACVKCKYTSCVEVCPVQCFYEGELMLAINPNECIDCGACVAECPVKAIEHENNCDPIWRQRNEELSKIWPKISVSQSPLPEAEKYTEIDQKFEKFVS